MGIGTQVLKPKPTASWSVHEQEAGIGSRETRTENSYSYMELKKVEVASEWLHCVLSDS